MKQAGAAAGVDFTGKCDYYPNSLSTHGLLKYAADTAPEKQNKLQEILFRQVSLSRWSDIIYIHICMRYIVQMRKQPQRS